MEEQILLCTLLPFRPIELLDYGPYIESPNPIQIIWRTNELRFVDIESRSLVLGMQDFADTSWTHLLGLPYCKLNVIYNVLRKPVGIRLYLLKEIILDCYRENAMCGTNFMAFEFSLAECLKNGFYTIEPKQTSKKKVIHDWLVKPIDLTLVAIVDTLHWCFVDLCFKTSEPRPPKTFYMKPTVLVSTMTNHWREILLDQLSKYNSNMLIITRSPELWPSYCKMIQANGLEFSQNENIRSIEEKNIYMASPALLNRNFEKRLELLDLVSSLSTNIYVNRKPHQIHRLLVDNLAKKFPSFKMPVDFHTFSAVLLDDFNTLDIIDILPQSMTKRWINIAYDKTHTKPRQLSYKQLKYSIRLETPLHLSAVYLPLLYGRTDSFLSTIEVPKNILRRYRIFGHLVRNAPIEDRIKKLFPNGCPLNMEDSIQRFSAKPMPKKIAADLITRHFQTLGSSLGEYSLPLGAPITPISADYVNKAMKTTPRECAICFEALTDSFRFSICGHVYCKDCTSVYFKPEWSLGKTKECCMCRLNLLTADVFSIEAISDDEYSSVLGSKAQSIQNFLGSTKGRCSYWPNINDSKTIIVDSVKTCFPELIVKHPGPLNLHVFYLSEESDVFLNLQSNFN